MRHRTDPEALRRTRRINRAKATIDDPNRVANKADDPRNGAGMGGCPWLKAINCTRASWRPAGFYCPGKRCDDVFIAPALHPSGGRNAPILSSCAGRFPTNIASRYSKEHANGTRLLESLRFLVFIAPALRAIGAQVFFFNRGKAQPRRHWAAKWWRWC